MTSSESSFPPFLYIVHNCTCVTFQIDIAAGRKYMKVYRQMKMYNDTDTNPVLYAAKK